MAWGDQEDEENKETQPMCEWCRRREAEEERLVIGLGFLHLCRECSLLLLSGIIDGG
jgi:hypothetical protein